jgi:hypothetical protein
MKLAAKPASQGKESEAQDRRCQKYAQRKDDYRSLSSGLHLLPHAFIACVRPGILGERGLLNELNRAF